MDEFFYLLTHISFIFVSFYAFLYFIHKISATPKKKSRSRFRIMLMFWSKLLTSCWGTMTLKFLILSLKIPWKHLEVSTEIIVRTPGPLHLSAVDWPCKALDKASTRHRQWLCNEKSHCAVGAVPRYWKVVASCFQFIAFAENTSAALAARASFFLNRFSYSLFFFFFFSCSWTCLQNAIEDFLILPQNLAAFKRRVQDRIGFKKAIFERFQMFNQLLVQNLKYWDTVFFFFFFFGGRAWESS